MIEITKKQFREWIFSQPADRRVNMLNGFAQSSLGCAIVQFAKDHNIPAWYCTGDTIFANEFVKPDNVDWPHGLFKRKVLAKFEKGVSIRSFWREDDWPKLRTFGQLQHFCDPRTAENFQETP